jgi:hypothetical protein
MIAWTRMRCGIFATARRNSAPLPGRQGEPAKNARIPCRRVSSRLASLLPLEVTSVNVLRTVLLSVVLTLAIGPNAGVVCKVWCHDASSTGCPHQDSATSPSVRADDNCTTTAVGAVTLAREDGRRTAPAPDAQNALGILRFRLVAPPTDPRSGHEPGRRRMLEERPLVIALRI